VLRQTKNPAGAAPQLLAQQSNQPAPVNKGSKADTKKDEPIGRGPVITESDPSKCKSKGGTRNC
jgi:hypothetical protein